MYYGWIPSILGQLSFSLIGSSIKSGNGRLAAGPLTRLRGQNDADRVLLIYQDQWTGDSAFIPPKWAIWLSRKFGNMGDNFFNTVVLLGHRPVGPDALTQRPMTGVMFSIVPGKLPHVGQNDEYAAIARRLHAAASITAPFKLERSGIVMFCRPAVKTSSKLTEDEVANEQQEAASRMFFALKDFVHVHQHHEDEDDIIIRLKQVKARSDFDWAKQILFSLYRYIVGQKQRIHDRPPREMHTVSSDLLGVLAYTRTFERVARLHWASQRTGAIVCPLPQFADKELEQSLIAARDSMKSAFDWRYAKKINNTLIGIGGAAVYYSLLQAILARASSADGVHAVFPLGQVVTDHFQSLLFAPPIMILFVWWVIHFFNVRLNGWGKDYLFDTIRVAFGMDKQHAVAAFFSLSISLMLLFLWLSWVLYKFMQSMSA
jgi:hypothetical protein